VLGQRFEEAAAYAVTVHGGQTRKRLDTASGPAVPYVAHLFGVTSLVLEDGGDEDEAIAALLHDAVEDQGGLTRLADISSRFGERVAAIVKACSDATPEQGAKKDGWWERKTAYMRHLDHLDRAIERAVLRVSMADKLYNLQATVRDARVANDRGVNDRNAFWMLFKTGAGGQLWYCRRLAAIYRQRCPESVLLPELEELLRDLEPLVSDEDRQNAAEYAATYS
jgi:HD domain